MNISELQTFFAKQAAFGFDHLPQIATSSRTAIVYSLTLDNGRKVVMKVFQNVPEEGIKARNLFELECSALESLKYTGRVSEIIFNSKELNYASELEVPKEFFIVKPYYDRFLEAQKKSITPLELLERAAQEVYISDLFFKYGWRDLDGDFGNDAVDENGMIIRVDLDGAQSQWAVSPKFGKLYHTKNDEHINRILVEGSRFFFSQISEVRSLAIRLSRLFLKNEEENWKLLKQISALGNRNVIETHDSSFIRSNILRLKKPVEKVKNKLPQIFHPKRKSRIVEKWLSHWEKSLTNMSPFQGALLREEAHFLGLIFHHILSQEDPDINTINDLYSSLMILLLVIIDARATEASGKGEKTRKQFVGIVKGLFEIRRHFEDISLGADTDEPAPLVLQEAIPTRRIVIKKETSAGNFWGAVRSKGSDWKSQDLVLTFTDGPGSAFLLADGSSGASGDRAIEIAQEVFAAWYPTVRPKTLSEAREALFGLLQTIHIKLTGLRKQYHRNYETTVVVGYIYKGLPTPTALLIRYGDSGFLVTHEKPDGSIFGITGTKGDDVHPHPLGSRLHSGLNPNNELQSILLDQPGIYRIRAYSDGLGGEKYAWDILSGQRRIQEIVDEAAAWPSIYPQIGADDWSVVGFDIEVHRGNIVPQKVIEESTRTTGASIFDLKDIENFDLGKFPLSERALKFWTNTFGDYLPVTKYPLLNKFREVRMDETYPFSQTVIPNRSVRYFVYAAILMIVLAAGLAGAFFCLNAFFGKDRKEASRVHASPPSTPSPKEPKFENPQQEEIYKILKKKQVFVLDGLPSGSAIDQEPLRSFIPDLARVLRETGWQVIIEVHTDLGGKPTGNMDRSNERRKAIEAKLPNCEVRAMGENVPRVSTADTEEVRKNRRLEVYLPRSY